jgi:hypothetical protein
MANIYQHMWQESLFLVWLFWKIIPFTFLTLNIMTVQTPGNSIITGKLQISTIANVSLGRAIFTNVRTLEPYSQSSITFFMQVFEFFLLWNTILWSKILYSHHLKTGQSRIQIVIIRTQFVSCFQMVKLAILFLTIRKLDQFSDHRT